MGVGTFNCMKCEGYGWLPDPDKAWWQFWKSVECPRCGGDGDAKPPGWPDKAEMERLRPDPPPAPPTPPREHAPLLVVNPQLSMNWRSGDDSATEETRELVQRLCREARENVGSENRHALIWITAIEDRLCEHLDGVAKHKEPAA